MPWRAWCEEERRPVDGGGHPYRWPRCQIGSRRTRRPDRQPLWPRCAEVRSRRGSSASRSIRGATRPARATHALRVVPRERCMPHRTPNERRASGSGAADPSLAGQLLAPRAHGRRGAEGRPAVSDPSWREAAPGMRSCSRVLYRGPCSAQELPRNDEDFCRPRRQVGSHPRPLRRGAAARCLNQGWAQRHDVSPSYHRGSRRSPPRFPDR